jgi:hypothetical protein
LNAACPAISASYSSGRAMFRLRAPSEVKSRIALSISSGPTSDLISFVLLAPNQRKRKSFLA